MEEKKKHTHNNRIGNNTVDLSKRLLSVTEARQQGLRKIDVKDSTGKKTIGTLPVKLVKKKSVQLVVTQRFNQRFVTVHESPEIAKRYATSHYESGSYKIEWKNIYGNQELLTGSCDRLHGLRRFEFQAERSDMFGKVCDSSPRGENEQLLIELHERTDTQENEHGEWITRVIARRSLIVLGGRKDTGSYASIPVFVSLTEQEQERYANMTQAQQRQFLFKKQSKLVTLTQDEQANYDAMEATQKANFMLDKISKLGDSERIRTRNDSEKKALRKLTTRDSFIQRWKGCTENQRLQKLYNRRCKKASRDSILGFALSPKHAYYAEQSWARYNAWLANRVRQNAGKPASTATERAQAFTAYFANVLTVREEQQIVERMAALGFMLASPVNACAVKTSDLDFSVEPMPRQAQAFLLSPLSEQALQDRLKYSRQR